MSLLWLLPESLLPIIVVVLAFAVMFGFMSIGTALLTILALALAPALIDPMVDLAFELLPWWLLLLLGVALFFSMCRLIGAFVLGGRAYDHVVGHLTAVSILGVFRLLFLPLRIGGWLLMRLFARG